MYWILSTDINNGSLSPLLDEHWTMRKIWTIFILKNDRFPLLSLRVTLTENRSWKLLTTNYSDKDLNGTIVNLACLFNLSTLSQSYIKYSFRIFTKDKSNKWFCVQGDISRVRRLLDEGRVSVNETTEEGESLLSLACSAGYYELAQVQSRGYNLLTCYL